MSSDEAAAATLPHEEEFHKHGIEGRTRIVNPHGEPFIGDVPASNNVPVTRDGAWMDAERKRIIAREYLTHIGEAKEWIEACINEELPPITELENRMRNGVVLAKLARFFCKEAVKRIHDEHQKDELNLRHSDNFNTFVIACRKVKLPPVYYFELTDLYDKKNMPKVVYMIHALSHYLAKLGLAPQINNLMGQLTFTDEELERTAHGLGNIQMPAFNNISASLDKELGIDNISEEEKIRRETRTMMSDYEASTRDLLQWIQSSTEKLSHNDFDIHDKAVVSQKEQETDHFKRDKARQSTSKQTLKEKFETINAKLASKDLGDYDCPAGLRPSDVQTAWEAMEAQERARDEALARAAAEAGRCKAYEEHADGLTGWFNAKTDEYNTRNFPDNLEEIKNLIAQLDQDKPSRKAKYDEIDELTQEYNALQNDQGYSAPSGKTVEDVHRAYERMEEAAANRSVALKEKQGDLEDEARAKHFKDNEDKIAILQANMRGALARKAYKERLQAWKEHEDMIERLQAHCKGFLVRRRIQAMKDYYKQHLDKIIKIQALARGRAGRRQYKNFTQMEDTPVDTIQRFLHLLDDSDRDFDEELELERLKEQVVYNIRDNNEREKELSALDIKIALLIKNRTSLEDVVETTAKFMKKMKRESTDPANLKTLDKEARHKLEGYQHLFYLLQTEPHYMAKLLFRMRIQDDVQKFVETIVLTLYGYAQNAREEYLLLKLFEYALEEEMKQVSDIQDLLKGNPVFIKLVVHYSRGAKEMQFLRELLQPLVKDILDKPELDLDVDPLSIYRNMIKDEESKTGQKSALPYDVSRSQALENDGVMKIFVRRLKDLRSITDKFLNAIIASIPKMPYGIRLIAHVMMRDLKAKFPNVEESAITKILGNLIYYRYINPAIVAPEAFDVIETVISATQRKNLAEISKMLQQISVNKLFEDEYFFLSALNEFIGNAKDKFYDFFNNCADVPPAEEHFQIDKYDDLTRTNKPTIYISTEELYLVHALLLQSLDDVAPNKKDPIRVILDELGPPPEGSAQHTSRGQEISLTLTNRFANVDSSEAVKQRLFVQTKRYCLNVLRVQRGANLLEILESDITQEQLKLYELQVARELQITSERAQKPGLKKSTTMEDMSSLSLEQVKKVALENLAQLETGGMVKKANNYQDMLNAIAKDIRNKNRRRIQRRAELAKMRQTLSHLQEKTSYLEDQKKSYMEYVNSCMSAMQDKSKKSKQKTVLPFTRQYYHIQELKRAGKQPKFGSYSYTAERLFQKGVLVELKDVPEKQRNLVSITISSDEIGVFQISGKFMGVSMDTMELRLEDLLQKQFDNVQVITILNTAKVNVNLLIYLLNKKFFV